MRVIHTTLRGEFHELEERVNRDEGHRSAEEGEFHELEERVNRDEGHRSANLGSPELVPATQVSRLRLLLLLPRTHCEKTY